VDLSHRPVLLCADDEAIAQNARKLLAGQGVFHVLAATCANEALETPSKLVSLDEHTTEKLLPQNIAKPARLALGGGPCSGS
jgi:hypothetical protein